MQEAIKLLATVIQQTKFHQKRMGTFTAMELRSIWSSDKLSARLVEPEVPENLLAKFTDQLRRLLYDYLDPKTDRIGNGLVDLMGGMPNPEINRFAEDLIRGAAILGPERLLELLFGWIKGEPFHYKTKTLLIGVSIDQPLALKEGIRISSLPKSLTELTPHLPLFSIPNYGYMGFLGGVILSVDCEAGPPFYAPTESEPFFKDFKHTWANGKIPGLSIETFCEALSLACNNYVYRKFLWRDFEDLEELNTAVGTGMSFVDVPTHSLTIPLSQKHLEQARDIHFGRSSFGEKRRYLDTAVSRWMKSKRPNAGLADKFIDLRIALEALYLENDYEGEKRFRLAVRGAWHLGANFTERKKYYKTLLDAYSRASKVVHADEAKITEKDKKLLADAQDACREGILKRLKEEQKQDWNEIILGKSL